MNTDHKEPVTAARPAKETESFIWHYLMILRRRGWVILSVTVVVATVGIVRVVRTPPVYRAAAKVLLERTTPQVVRIGQALPEGSGWDPEFYQTQAQLVRSRAVLEIAMEETQVRRLFEAQPGRAPAPRGSLGGELKRTALSALGASPSATPEMWELLRGAVGATHVADTHFLVIESYSGEPQQAMLLANAAAKAFQEYHRRKWSETFGEAFAGLAREKEKEEQQLLEAEKALQEFKERARGVSVGESEKDQPVLDRLIKLNQKLTEVQLRRIELKAQLGIMQEVLKAEGGLSATVEERLFALPVIQNDAVLTGIRKALAEAEKEIAILANTYGAEHPLLQSARTKQNLLREQFKSALNEVVRSQFSELTMLEAQEQDLAREAEAQKQEALSLEKESFTLTRLQATVDRHRRLFDAIVERMREVDISSGLLRTNVQLVELASLPRTPANAGKLRRVLLAVCMGLFLGIGLALVLENLDDAVRTPEDLRERLRVPLLGFVPAMDRAKPERARRAKTAADASPAPAAPNRGLAVLLEPSSSVAEAYRTIRTSLLYSSPGHEIKTLVMTSCRPEEGKTTTTTNLAVCMAQLGKRVLVVDGDLHRPQTHKIFGVSNVKGLSTVLVGEADWQTALQKVRTPEGKVLENLDLLTAGPVSPNPSELLGSRTMKELVALFREQYEWVFIDTPPILFVSDAMVLTMLSDGVILVVRAGLSSRTVLNRVYGQLVGMNARIIGSVLNNTVVSRFGRGYSYYSYYGYSRYAKDYHRSYYGTSRGEAARRRAPAAEADASADG